MRAREAKGTLVGNGDDCSMPTETAEDTIKAIGAEEAGKEDAGVATGSSTRTT